MSKRESVLTPPTRRPPPRGEPPHTSHQSTRTLAVSATAVTFVLIAVGGLVRATGSGLGCMGWPKCSAHRWLPPLQYHALIEYTHRMTAFVDIVLVAALAVVAWRRYRHVPRVLRPAVGAAGLIVVQAILGGIVVKGDLAALLVTAHFATAMVLAATLAYATVASFTLEAAPSGPFDRLTRFAAVAAGSVFALLLLGAYVRGQNAGLAFVDWPLMGGRLVPSLGRVGAALMFAHRVMAIAVGVVVASFVPAAWRGARPDRPAVAALGLAAGGLYLAQVLIGAALVWSRLAAPVRVAHETIGALIWGALVAAAAVARAASQRGSRGGAVARTPGAAP
jgi:heme A synthase